MTVRSWLALFLLVLGLSASLLVPVEARAESVAALAKKLAESDDFRVRTQAALALGGSADKKAVTPLCGGLDDESDTVRAAAAAALGRLALGGTACLERRKGRESSKNVLKMIDKALRLIAEAASGPALGGASKHYVALLPPRVNGKRTQEIAAAALTGLRDAGKKSRGIVFAPEGEKLDEAKKRLRKHPEVLGWALQPQITVRYDDPQLVVEVTVDILAYPEKTPQGSLSQRAGKGGIKGTDEAAEDDLVQSVCRDAFKKFVEMAEQVN